MNKRDVTRLSVVLAALSAFAAIAVVVGLVPVVRAPLVFAALVSCPGWAIVCWLKVLEWPLMWSTAVGLSCSLVVLLSMGLMSADLWYPRIAVTALLVLSSAVLAMRTSQGLRFEAPKVTRPDRREAW